MKPDTLEWRLWPNKDGSITLQCRAFEREFCDWNCLISIGTDGKLYPHEWMETSLLEWGPNRSPVFVPGKPSWNTNVEELKNHFRKLVSVKNVDGVWHGVLHAAEDSGIFVGPNRMYLSQIEKFCVHELPEDN